MIIHIFNSVLSVNLIATKYINNSKKEVTVNEEIDSRTLSRAS